MSDARRGVLLMSAAMLVFAGQDALSTHLARVANPVIITTYRYWAFALFVLILSARRPGGLRAALRSARPALQWARGGLLAIEIVVTVAGFALIGLIDSHAVFAIYPLVVVALSGPLLGEKIGWRRWAAVGVGFLGVLIILRPGLGALRPGALIPLAAAGLFAVYHVMTRAANRLDGAGVSFLYTGLGGVIVLTLLAPFFHAPLAGWDWAVMAALCVTGMGGHLLLIMALEAAEASTVQPFAFLQLVFASLLGWAFFDERMDMPTAIGAAVVVAAGVFSMLRGGRREN